MPVDVFGGQQIPELEQRQPIDIFGGEEVAPPEPIEEKRRPILRLPEPTGRAILPLGTKEEAIEGLNSYLKASGNLAKSIGMGLGNDLLKVHNFFATHPIAKAVIKPFAGEIENLPEFDIEKAPMPGVAAAAQELGALAPAFIPPIGEEAVVGKAVQAGSKLLPRMIPHAEAIGRGLGRTGARATYGAGQMAALEKIFGDKDEEENVKNAALAGAVLNTVPRALFHAVPHALRGLVSHLKKYARETGRIPSPEEAQTIINSLGGDDVLTLADVTKSPKLRSIYHGFMKHLPFSGVKAKQAAQIKEMERQSTNVFNDLLHGAEPEDFRVRESIADKIGDISKDNYNKATSLYDKVYDVAEKAKDKFSFIPESVQTLRNTLTEEAENAGKTLGEYLKPKQLKALDDLDDVLYYKKVPIKGAKPKISFKAVSDLRSKYSKDATSKWGTGEGRFWRRLVESLDEDTERAAGKADLHELTNLKKDASDYYKNNVVPFTKSKDVSNILRRNIDFNDKTLENTLRDTRHQKVLDALPEQDRNRLGRLLLDDKIPNDAEYATSRIVDAYKNLSPYEKKVIITPKTKEKLDTLTKNYEMLKPAFDSAKQNIFQALMKMGKAGHAARLAGLGGLGLGAYKAGIVPSALGAGIGAVAGRALGSPQLLRAYAYGERVPGEIGAKRLTSLVSPFGRAVALAELKPKKKKKKEEKSLLDY